MALIKRGGQLFEQKDDSLMNRVNQLGTSTPTSPAGAAGIGASPDSAKMVGSGAQRENALREAVAPKEATLAGQQRLAGPSQATTADQEAQQKAQQLRQLGAMGTRVQSMLEQRLATAGQQAGPATIQADTASVQNALGLTPTQLAADQQGANVVGQAQGLINQYMTNPSEDLLLQLTELGMPKDKVYELTGLTETGQQATGRTIANAMADRLTVGELDLTELGFADISEVEALVPGAANMSVPEFQQAIEELQGAEFDKLEELRAQLAGLPPNSARAQQIREQMQALGDVGRTGAEAAVEQAAQEINTADEVTIAGETYTVEEFLSDDTMSELIEDYLMSDPEDRDEIFPPDQFGELRSWIEQNQVELNTLIESATETQESFEQANIEWTGMTDDLGMDETRAAAIFGYDPSQTMTSQQLAEWKQSNNIGGDTGAGSIYELGPDGKVSLKAGNELIANDITADNKDLIADMSEEEIKASHQMTDAVENNPTLASLAGITDTSANFLSREQMAQAANWQAVADRIEDSPILEEAFSTNPDFAAAVKNGTVTPDWMQEQYVEAVTDPLALELIQNGQLTAENRDELLADWQNKRDAFQREQDKLSRLNAAYEERNLDAMLDEFLGPGTTPEQIEQSLIRAEAAAKLGDPEAQSMVAKYQSLLDIDSLQSRAGQNKSLMDFLQGTNTSIKSDVPRNYSNERFGNYIEMIGSDGVLSAAEMQANPGLVEQAAKDGVDLSQVASSESISQFLDSSIARQISPEGQSLIDRVKSNTFRFNMGTSRQEAKETIEKLNAHFDTIQNPYPANSVMAQRFDNQLRQQRQEVTDRYREEYDQLDRGTKAQAAERRRKKEIQSLIGQIALAGFGSSSPEETAQKRRRLSQQIEDLKAIDYNELFDVDLEYR